MTQNKVIVVCKYIYIISAWIGSACLTSISAEETNSWNSSFVKGVKTSEYRDSKVTGKEFTWGDLKPNDFGPKQVEYDTTGMRQLPELPPPGVHPRILFTREQLPDIRRRLKTTRVGKHMWNAILQWTEELKGRYDNNADYTKPDLLKGSFGTHGFTCKFRAGALKGGEVWQEFVNGNTEYKIAEKQGTLGKTWGIFPLEALRCLVDEDNEAGEKLGKAIETAIINWNTHKDNFGGNLSAFNVAYTYDLAYQWLSPKARKLLREYLIEAAAFGDHYGAFEVAQRASSNWSTFTYSLISILAIEGEPGFNDLKYLGMLRSWRCFYNYGWYETGACYEGMGKNQLGGDALVMFSLRGENIAGHPHIRAYISERVPREILPGDSRFFFYDRWGGLKHVNSFDAMAMKYLYPNDKAIDFVYRKAIGWDDENLKLGSGRLLHYWNTVLIETVFADDPLPDNNSHEKAADGKKTFFCGERNLMSTRSDWEDDALFLNFQARPFNGGHVFADRNTFHFVGNGVEWFIKRPIAYDTDMNNTVTIDGKLQSRWTPARIVDFEDNDKATFVVGDGKYTWNWEIVPRDTWQGSMGIRNNGHTRLPRGGEWEPVWETSNDFSYKDTPEPYLNKPIYERIHWNTTDTNNWDMMAKRPIMNIEKAFRTAGIVRGDISSQSYTFIMDDIKVDDNEHLYEWIGQLDVKTKIWKIEESYPGTERPQKTFTRDIYLFKKKLIEGKPGDRAEHYQDQEAPEEGQPVLLVRFVDIDLGEGETLKNNVKLDVSQFENRKFVNSKTEFHRLIVESKSVSPNFKVILYPFYYGENSLPQTHWKRNSLLVSWPNSKATDILSFSYSETGKLDMKITRNRKELIDISEPVPHSPDRTPKVKQSEVEIPTPIKTWDFSSAENLSFSKGQYSGENAKIENGVAIFGPKGHQQITLPEFELPSRENFTITLRVKTEGDGIRQILSDDDWLFSLGNWNAIGLTVNDDSAAVRQTKENIDDWFHNNWANVAIVKKGKNWSIYVNGQLKVINQTKENLTNKPFKLKIGNSNGSVWHGMLGQVDEINVFDKALSYEEILNTL